MTITEECYVSAISGLIVTHRRMTVCAGCENKDCLQFKDEMSRCKRIKDNQDFYTTALIKAKEAVEGNVISGTKIKDVISVLNGLISFLKRATWLVGCTERPCACVKTYRRHYTDALEYARDLLQKSN